MQSNNKPNQLIHEKSPYLLQHAHNPVNWYPWGAEAFEKAKQEKKPIFLSIGYSTCHWCHVLAHESFEDPEVADYLNEHYIAIKVDREERPDIDSVYMKVCQMMTGHGGWPLSIFMTPDKIPFYAGTYFPRKSQYGMPGFMDVLTQLNKEFTEDPEHVEKITKSVTDALNKAAVTRGQKRLSSKYTIQAYQLLEDRFDSTYGGFGVAPKFPAPQNVLFLMRFYHSVGKKDALRMAENTLKAMAAGGIYDHVGFGFARYSTDEKWLVPHFEKMLYDNALLAIAYTEGYQITKNPRYRKIAEQIIQFVMREMKNPDGGFYSAIDADSEGVEGKYYVWDYDEVLAILGERLGKLYTTTYNITPEGNFEGKNVPNLIGVDLDHIAMENDLTTLELEQQLEQARCELLSIREKRVYPHVDDKVLTSWNAMMITALAKAGKVFENTEYIRTAQENLSFIENTLIQNGRVMARYRDGDVNFNGYLDDYAFLLWAYNELYSATFSLNYLKKAKQLANDMTELFWDNDQGGFFFSGYDNEKLLSREKEIFDGALPSGNSVAAVNLAQLGYLTGETVYLDQVAEMYYTFYEETRYNIAACSHFMQSLLLTEVSAKEVVVLGEDSKLTKKLQLEFTPNVMVLTAEDPEQLTAIAPFASQYKKLNEEVSYYVCENFACQKPTNDPEKAWKLIRK